MNGFRLRPGFSRMRVSCLAGLILVLVLLEPPFALADKYFPHGVVGSASGVSAVTTIELAVDQSVGMAEGSQVLGVLRFFSAAGSPKSLRVTGGGYNGVVLAEVPFALDASSGPVKQSYVLQNSVVGQDPFWCEILEQVGSVTGKLQFDLYQGGVLATSIPVPAVGRRQVTSFMTRWKGVLKTGIAIANPSNLEAAYWIVALDGFGEVVDFRRYTLHSREQTAKFIDQFFPALTDGFDGFVSVISQKDLACLGLEQVGLELSTTGDAGPLKLPFLVGKLEDYLSRDVLHEGDSAVSFGKLTLTKGSTIVTATASVDGHYLLGPLFDGDWRIRVDAAGYLAYEQDSRLPALPRDIQLTSLHHINPEWLSETLAVGTSFEGMVVKPGLPLNFFFDNRAFTVADTAAETAVVEEVRQVFKQWVSFGLPQLGPFIEDATGVEVPLGGSARYRESDLPPKVGTESTVILSASSSLAVPAKATVFVRTVDTTSAGSIEALEMGEAADVRAASLLPRVVRAALVEYNPTRLAALETGVPAAEVSRVLWAAVFLRSEAFADVETYKVSGVASETETLSEIWTVLTRDPQTLVSTPYDAFYWEVIRRRPVGTVIQADRESLPRQ